MARCRRRGYHTAERHLRRRRATGFRPCSETRRPPNPAARDGAVRTEPSVECNSSRALPAPPLHLLPRTTAGAQRRWRRGRAIDRCGCEARCRVRCTGARGSCDERQRVAHVGSGRCRESARCCRQTDRLVDACRRHCIFESASTECCTAPLHLPPPLSTGGVVRRGQQRRSVARTGAGDGRGGGAAACGGGGCVGAGAAGAGVGAVGHAAPTYPRGAHVMFGSAGHL
eukprot:ctg_2653.g576